MFRGDLPQIAATLNKALKSDPPAAHFARVFYFRRLSRIPV
jgi:hypothetical protein